MARDEAETRGPTAGAYSSSPCYACEVDPDYMLARRMNGPELRDFLGFLLNAERALAAALDDPAAGPPPEAMAGTRAATADAEVELARQVERLGGAVPPDAGGPNPARPEAGRGGCAVLVSRQRALLEEIGRAMPLIEDWEVAAALARVRAAHSRALAGCEAATERA